MGFDADDHINIWGNPADVIGSVVSYFKRRDSGAGELVVVCADVQGERADESLTQGIKPVKTGVDLRALCRSGHDAPPDGMPVTASSLDAVSGL